MKIRNNILITGGAGFIGANLVRRLCTNQKNLEQQLHLLVEKDTNLWRLHDISSELNIHEIDLTDVKGVRKLVHTIKPTIIYHLASYGGMCTQLEADLIYNVNFTGTVNLLRACKEVGFDCFINTGSSSEYGMQNVAMSENLVLAPVSDYGVAKAAATQFCLKEALVHQLPIYTIRPFSVYGDYEMPTRLIPTVLVNAILQQPIHLSSPHFVRDYIYVQDMIDLFIAVAEQQPTAAHIFNGGTGVQSTIGDVISTVQSFFSEKLSVIWGTHTPRPWEPKAWKADITQSRNIFNWKPQYSLHDGIKASLAWFEKNLNYYAERMTLPPHNDNQQRTIINR